MPEPLSVILDIALYPLAFATAIGLLTVSGIAALAIMHGLEQLWSNITYRTRMLRKTSRRTTKRA